MESERFFFIGSSFLGFENINDFYYEFILFLDKSRIERRLSALCYSTSTL